MNMCDSLQSQSEMRTKEGILFRIAQKQTSSSLSRGSDLIASAYLNIPHPKILAGLTRRS